MNRDGLVNLIDDTLNGDSLKPDATAGAADNEDYDAALCRTEVQACFARYSAAHIEVDVASLDELLADDYQHFHASGRIDGKQSLIERLKSGEIRHLAKEYSFVTIKTYGRVAVLSGRGRNTVLIGGHEKVIENLFTTVWTKVAQERWAITSWTAAPVTNLTHFEEDSRPTPPSIVS